MAKPVIKFKTYRQAAAVGGKIYGVPNLGDPVVASVTMQEVIDYAKLHNYSAATLEALLSQVISGVADLVARDGKPRNLSDLLKFEPVIKGTFNTMEQTVTNQKILVRPRLLKEIRVKLDAGDYAWQNQNDKDSPRLISVAPADSSFPQVDLAAFIASVPAGQSAGFGWTYAGSRLCPNGYDANCSFSIVLRRAISATEIRDIHLEESSVGGETYGYLTVLGVDPGTDNTLTISAGPVTDNQGWYIDASGNRVRTDVVPVSGDIAVFSFTRKTAAGDTFTVEKSYTL